MHEIIESNEAMKERALLFNYSLDMLCITSLEGEFKDINPAWETTLGYPKGEMLNRTFLDFVYSEDLDQTSEMAKKLAQGEAVQFFTSRFLCKGGDYRWLSWTAHPLIEEGLVYSVVRDITMRKENEAQLTFQKQLFEELFNNTPDGVVQLDNNHNIVKANQQFADLFGYEKEELVGKDINQVVDPYSKVKVYLSNLVQQWGQKVSAQEIRYTKEGRPIYVYIRGCPIIIDGKGVGSYGIYSDITKEKEIEKKQGLLYRQLEEKNKELEQLIYIISHDLRSPLVNIQGFTRELTESIEELKTTLTTKQNPVNNGEINHILEQDIPEYISYINSSTSKISSILNGLLSLSRLGKSALRPREIETNSLINNALVNLRIVIKEKAQTQGLEIKVDNLPKCWGDELQISQLFSNLIENGIKYLDPTRPGVITITGTEKEDHVVFGVEDNGIGIDEKYHHKIFNIFMQVNSQNSTGEGIGLAIVERIVRQHKGEIWLESKPGIGSKFCFTLPNGK